MDSPMPIEQPECWTSWLRNSKDENYLIETLKFRDRRFQYTVVHALVASNNSTLCERSLFLFKNGRAEELFIAKDKEGDRPMHSAIRSHVDPRIITTFLEAAESVDASLKEAVLTSVNNKGECPLKFAYMLHDWRLVELLLRECIRCGLLGELTGIHRNRTSTTTRAKTLLCKAMKCGDINYLEIYLKVCKDLCLSSAEILDGMLIPDQKNRTPWFYFLAIESYKIKQAIDLLEKYEISLNELYCEVDKASQPKAYMLHEAARQEKEEIFTLLCNHGIETNKKDGNGLTAKQRSRKIMPSTDTPQRGLSVMKVNPEGVKRKLDLGDEVLSRQADVLPEAGLSSDSTIDVSLSPGIEPSPQYPTSSIAGWQSTEVPGDQMEHNDDQDALTTCTEDTQAPLFYIGDQLYLSTADSHSLSSFSNNRFSSPLQFRKCKLYDNDGDSEHNLLLEFSSLSSPILGELHEGLKFITDEIDSSPAQIFLPGCSLTNRRLPDLRPVRRLDHLQLELNSSTTVPFFGEMHYDQIYPKYADHEVCPLSNASYMPTSCIWSNTKFNHSFPT